ncbi:LRC14-like protein [Mya arenaria]|uniref:LRC14-like protein n=1 Tax=Mya arenaria TaxID=6604 RepID=A0ABY7FEP8_MYAAR|nr:LRC14-like protein [Mya arenaria]
MSQMNSILAGMQTTLQYDHFKGVLYPLDFGDYSSTKPQTFKSLVEIVADFVVKDSTMTLHALEMMPQEIITVLMQQALEGNRDRAVDVLLTKWPLTTLNLNKFAPNIFNNLSILHSHLELTKTAKQGLRYTTCIAHNFLETLKRKCDTRLKYVDISGYPTAHNEARQNMMIRKYEEAIKLLPEEESNGKLERFTTDQSLPDDHFAVKLDVFISSEAALYELCKALKVSGFRESTLRLIVNKLDATCLGSGKIDILLEQINPEHLQSLSLKYNSISSGEMMKLCPLIGQLTRITTIDLSSNMISLMGDNSELCDKLSGMFTSLVHLIRLDLSNNILRGKLRSILTCVVLPLQYLGVENCGLTAVDIAYLSYSHHSNSMQELALSNNNLRHCSSSFIALLRNLKSCVKHLEIENCSLTDHHTESLAQSVQTLIELVYLNLRYNAFTRSSLCQVGVSAGSLSKLQYLRVSYATDCYDSDLLDDEQEELKKEFVNHLGAIVFNEQKKLELSDKVLNVVFSELF